MYLEIDTRGFRYFNNRRKRRVFSARILEILQTNPSRAHDFPPDWAGKEIFSISLNLLRGLVMPAATFTILYDENVNPFPFQRKRTIEILSALIFILQSKNYLTSISYANIDKI